MMKRSNPAIRRRLVGTLAVLAAGCALSAPVLAQDRWPDKPIRVVIPYPPGGPSSIVTRAAFEKAQSKFDKPIVIENKPGAGGNIGTSEVARANPDGYTWLVAVDTAVTINPHIFTKLQYSADDLVPVTVLSDFSQTLVCNPQQGAKTVADLMRQAKEAGPGKLAYASGGAGVPGHMAMELLAYKAGVKMLNIPYKGPGPAAKDVVGGQVPCGVLAGPTVLPLIKAGRLVALGVSGATRSPVLPDVPSIAETYPGYDATFSLVLFAPRGTPQSIIDRFGAAVREALHAPDVIKILKQSDQDVVGNSQKASAARLADRSHQWGDVARRIGLRID
ncbi:MAG: Bug family tripartite tricarboxylate transporter substrate binding protein [Caldimonas sp.]